MDLLDRTADLVATHPLASLIAALLLGLAVPARVRRLVQRTVAGILVVVKWTLIVGFWVAVTVYLLPVGVIALACHLGGIRLLPDDTGLPSDTAQQLSLPFDR
jgi:hypothetical protein